MLQRKTILRPNSAHGMSECRFYGQVFCKFWHKLSWFLALIANFASFHAPYALAQRPNLLQMRRAFQASSPKLFSPALVPGFFLPGTILWPAGLFSARHTQVARRAFSRPAPLCAAAARNPA
jgi:hypothetical protein